MASSAGDPDRLTAALADLYRIEREIGSGGMATVYLARDLKHDRQVAVKVLNPELAETLGAERFLREIRTAANLSHPHILPVHDSGEADGFLYFVMPYVKGETLRTRLTKEKQLPVEDAVRITREVADALAYAHREGVVHRDVKPANIMLQEGHAVLADFGVAHAVAEARDERITRTGTSLGTPAYMSPEQASGERGLDGRSDQYGLGCVLYEMLAGHPPFSGSQVEAVLRQHLTVDPPPVTQSRPSVPEEVVGVLERSLAKSPADRFRTTGEMAAALEGPITVRTSVSRSETPDDQAGIAQDEFPGHSRTRTRTLAYTGLAVLALAAVAAIGSQMLTGDGGSDLSEDVVVVIPFSNETGDPDNDYIDDILGWRISQALEATGVAWPVPWQTVSSAWDAAVGRREPEPGTDLRSTFAGQWGAGTVVSGSVFSQAGQFRFEAEIAGSGGKDRIGAIDPVLVHPDSVEGGVDQVSQRVAAIVGLYLDPGFRIFNTDVIPAMPSMGFARDYIRAIDASRPGDWNESLRLIKRALSQDSTYVMGRLWLATAHLNLGHYAAVDSILDDLEEQYGRMSVTDRFSWAWNRAMLDGDREGAYQAAREFSEKTGTPIGTNVRGFEALRLNRVKEAAQVLSDLGTRYSGFPARVGGYWHSLCSALHLLEDHDRELEEARKGRAHHPDSPEVLRAEVRAQAALGNGLELRELVEEAFVKDAEPLAAITVAAEELRVHGYEADLEDLRRLGLQRLEPRLQWDEGSQANRPTLGLLQALYALGDWDRAETTAEDLAQRAPANVYVLGYLGALAARRGDAEEALRISEELANLEGTYLGGRGSHERARIHALLGDREMAVQLLRKAHEEGFPYGVELHSDPDLLPLRGYPPFDEFMRPRG